MLTLLLVLARNDVVRLASPETQWWLLGLVAIELFTEIVGYAHWVEYRLNR
jgi:hypothetical protein